MIEGKGQQILNKIQLLAFLTPPFLGDKST